MENIIKQCEDLYPESATEFKKIQAEMYALWCKKHMDYGPENIALGKDLANPSNKRMSLLGIWFRSNDKVSRIANLLNNQLTPLNESLEDSWIDLCNYSIISMIVNRGKWGK